MFLFNGLLYVVCKCITYFLFKDMKGLNDSNLKNADEDVFKRLLDVAVS